MSLTKYTKISDLSPQMAVPFCNVIVAIDRESFQETKGGGEIEVGDATGSVLLRIPRSACAQLGIGTSGAEPAEVYVVKGALVLLMGGRIVLQLSEQHSAISPVRKLANGQRILRNKNRNISQIKYSWFSAAEGC